MKNGRFFLGIMISALLLVFSQGQVYAADNLNISSESNKLTEIVKEVFPEYKERFEIPQIKNNINYLETRKIADRKVIFRETRNVDAGYHSYSGDLVIGHNLSPYFMQISNFKYTLLQKAYDKIDNFGSCFVTAPSGGGSSSIMTKIANETSGRLAQASYTGTLVGSVPNTSFPFIVDIHVGNDSCIVSFR